MTATLKKGDKAIVKNDRRHPKGTVVEVINIAKNSDCPYYCQTDGGFVCGFYNDEDLEVIDICKAVR